MKHFYDKKNILITGGAGFIGSHVTHALVDKGANVTIVDDLSTGTENNFIPFKKKIRFLHGSITDRSLCLEALQNVDIVFHLAALVSVPESVANPDLCMQINVGGTINLLQACVESSVRHLVFASSSAVYGSYQGLCSETTFCHPESPYGYSKRIGELLCKQYFEHYGLSTICLRYFNVYGARQRNDGPYVSVVAAFKKAMAHNDPITIFGNGLQKRDFVPVEKVVEATLSAGSLDNCHDVYNVASGTSITLLELFEKIKEEFPHYDHEITFKPARTDDITISQAECSHMNDLIVKSGLHAL